MGDTETTEAPPTTEKATEKATEKSKGKLQIVVEPDAPKEAEKPKLAVVPGGAAPGGAAPGGKDKPKAAEPKAAARKPPAAKAKPPVKPAAEKKPPEKKTAKAEKKPAAKPAKKAAASKAQKKAPAKAPAKGPAKKPVVWNKNEAKVLAIFKRAKGAPVTLEDIAKTAFSSVRVATGKHRKGKAKGKKFEYHRGQSWARNSIRRLRGLGLVRKVGRGTYRGTDKLKTA